MKKIAILGASYLQLPLILKCKELKHETHCFAWSEGAVCKDIADYFYDVSVLDKETILKICKEIKIDAILTIATDISNTTISYVCNELGLIGNTIECSFLTTDKNAMRKAMQIGNCPIPKFFHIRQDDILNHDLKFPVIVKPTDRSGSRGVVLVYSSDELNKAVETALLESLKKEILIEEFIEGKEYSVETISFEGQHFLLNITEKKVTNPPYFVELEHHQPAELDINLIEKVKNETFKLLDVLKVRYGAAHTELKITADSEIFFIELGSRMGGDFIGSDLVYLSTGYDYLKGVIDISLGNFNTPVISKNEYAGIYFLSEETKHLLKYFESNYDFIIRKELLNDDIKKVQNSNDRSGYIIYKSKSKFKL